MSEPKFIWVQRTAPPFQDFLLEARPSIPMLRPGLDDQVVIQVCQSSQGGHQRTLIICSLSGSLNNVGKSHPCLAFSDPPQTISPTCLCSSEFCLLYLPSHSASCHLLQVLLCLIARNLFSWLCNIISPVGTLPLTFSYLQLLQNFLAFVLWDTQPGKAS